MQIKCKLDYMDARFMRASTHYTFDDVRKLEITKDEAYITITGQEIGGNSFPLEQITNLVIEIEK